MLIALFYLKERRYEMDKVKAEVIVFLTLLSSWMGILAIPMIILLLCNLIDYGTGIAASNYRGEKVNSYKSFRGIAKKICMWLLVLVGVIVDMLIIYATKTVGVSLPVCFLFACAVTVWEICNELISILENIKDIGAKIPAFLQPIIKNIQKQVDDKADLKEDEKNVDKD